MLKIGASTLGQILEEQDFKDLKASKIEALELSFSNYREFFGFDFKKYKDLADKYNIMLWSLHLPFGPFHEIDPSTFNVDMRKFTFDKFLEIIKMGADIGIDKFVVHPSAEPNKDEERQEKLKIVADFFNELAEKSYNYRATIAIEDLPRTCLGNCSDDINFILSANEKLRVCYDTNHLLNENNIDFIKKLGSNIITLHVSDYDFLNERHWLPGEGDNDWQAIYNALIDGGYNGVWLYEVSMLPYNTIERRKLTYKDFYNNAIEIMSGKKPTPIGKRADGLTSW